MKGSLVMPVYYAHSPQSPSAARWAQQVYPVLVSLWHSRSTATYERVAELIGWHHRPLRNALGPIMHWCEKNELPPLTALVVNKHSCLPGPGFNHRGKPG